MGQLTSMLAIVLFINMMLWTGSIVLFNINPDIYKSIECKDNILSQFDGGTCNAQYYSLNESVALESLPSSDPSSVQTTGNLFTDTFNAMKNWMLQKTGLSYVTKVVSAPYYFLQGVLPGDFAPVSVVLSFAWYGLSLFLFINWLRGGDA